MDKRYLAILALLVAIFLIAGIGAYDIDYADKEAEKPVDVSAVLNNGGVETEDVDSEEIDTEEMKEKLRSLGYLD